MTEINIVFPHKSLAPELVCLYGHNFLLPSYRGYREKLFILWLNMISSIPQKILKPRLRLIIRHFQGRTTGVVETANWFMFPRETEGNIYKVNWSLVGEGVTPTQEAFRNARTTFLASHLPAKPAAGKVETSKPTYFGEYQLQESGDKSLSVDAFAEMSSAHKKYLSFVKNLYVEDAAVGSFSPVRMGVRIISDYPELALASRALLVSF